MVLHQQIKKLFFKSLLTIAGFCCIYSVKASHILGGEIVYKHLGNKKYGFTLFMYRNCGSCEFNQQGCPNIQKLDIFESSEISNNPVSLASINVSFVKKIDITGVCKSAKTNCQNNQSTVSGIEKWEFYGEFDFGTLSSNSCYLDIAVSVDSRELIYGNTFAETFFNRAVINFCNASNNSATLMTDPIFIVPLNQSFSYNVMAVDQDGDSLSYQLVKAERAYKQSITYRGIYTYSHPILINCTGTTNCEFVESSWPYRGIKLDKENGWLGFTATNNSEIGIFVIEISEWRKIAGIMTVVGKTRRDMLCKVIDVQNNVTKISTNTENLNACSLQNLNVDYFIEDENFGSNADTVKTNVYCRGKKVNSTAIINGNYNRYDGALSIFVDSTFKIGTQYPIHIVTEDNACPYTSRSYRTLNMTVIKTPNAKFVVTNLGCGKVQIKSAENSGFRHAYFIFDGNKSLIDAQNSSTFTYTFNRGGKFYILHQISESLVPCVTESWDSITIPEIKPNIQFQNNWPNAGCKGSVFNVVSNHTGGTAPYTYRWNNIEQGNFFSTVLTEKKTIQLEITDVHGCKASTSHLVNIFDLPNYIKNDTSLCFEKNELLPIHGLVRIDKSDYKTIVFSKHRDETNYELIKFGNQFSVKPLKHGKHTVFFTILDNFGCTILDSIQINFVLPVKTGIVHEPLKICADFKQVDLNEISRCQVAGGTWFLNNEPLLNGIFIPALAQSGVKQILFTIEFNKGCIQNDSLTVDILDLPQLEIVGPKEVTICAIEKNYRFFSNQVNCLWDAPANEFGVIEPQKLNAAEFNSFPLQCSFQDPQTGCTNFDTVSVKIIKPVEWSELGNQQICSGTPFAVRLKARNTNSITTIANNLPQGWEWKRLSQDSFVLFTPFSDKVQSVCYSINLEALKPCKDVSYSFCIVSKPSPVYKLNIDTVKFCLPSVLRANILLQNGASASGNLWKFNNSIIGQNTSSIVYPVTQIGKSNLIVQVQRDGCFGPEIHQEIQSSMGIKARISINPGNALMTADLPVFTVKDATNFAGTYSRIWQFEKSAPRSTSNSEVKVMGPSQPGEYVYSLTVTSEKGCTDTDSIQVKILKGFTIFAPNTFTPEGFGPTPNETFKIITDSCSEFKMVIKSRWGNIVYQTSNQYEGWNGMTNGSLAPNGVYIWKVTGRTVFGRVFTEEGYVNLMR